MWKICVVKIKRIATSKKKKKNRKLVKKLQNSKWVSVCVGGGGGGGELFSNVRALKITSRKHAYIILIPLNHTFIW